MDQAIRNKLRSVVTQCRKLLEDSVSQELQGRFGIYAAKKDTVQVDDDARMTHLSAEELAARKDLLDHYMHIKARGFKPKDALDQLIREIAYTHLNRFCAYKMMEARQVYVGDQKFRDAVSKGVHSNGVKFYLADHPEDERLFNTGKQDVAYRHFLDWLGGLLSEEIGVLFNPSDSANRLYPTQKVLDEVFALINDEALAGIWTQDETIGWVYQYFTPKELRDQARKESAAPRNSYELAFRNQFFTPHYVVEFLADNTLGRIWYEMRKGDTRIKDQCRYMVRRPTEVFLAGGEQPPTGAEAREDLSQEELLKQPVYIPHRPKKDPRELKILDPACGSGHFLLYCFDLLFTIYEEAYDDPDLAPALRKDYPALADLKKAAPGLILGYNLHGIDIDLRCTQIAALAIWLRCQRAYQDFGLKKEGPKITRANIVCAEPMPGEEGLLDEFLKTLHEDRLEVLIRRVMKVPEGNRVRATRSMADSLSELVRLVWDKMQLAGEAGSLLKIEKELQEAIRNGQEEWEEKQPLLRISELSLREEPKDGYLRFVVGEGVNFWERAEALVMAALHDFAAFASNGKGIQRRLFVDDALRGFAFVDLSRQRFDVVLMNPPFGNPTRKVKGTVGPDFKHQPNDLYCWFVARAEGLIGEGGLIGCITSSSFKTYVDYETFRTKFLTTPQLSEFADSSYCIDFGLRNPHPVPFFDVREHSDKAASLLRMVSDPCSNKIQWRVASDFVVLASAPIIYEWPKNVLIALSQLPSLESLCDEIGKGAGPHAFFYRLRWEVPANEVGLPRRWATFVNGGAFSPFRREDRLVLDWEESGKRVKEHILKKYPYLNGNTGWNIQLEDFYGKPGLTYGKKTTNFSAQTLPEGCIFSFEGIGVFPKNEANALWLLAYLNSSFCSWFLNATCGLHKNPPYLRRLPVPEFSKDDRIRLQQITSDGWRLQCDDASNEEVSSSFCFPTEAFHAFAHHSSGVNQGSNGDRIAKLLAEIDGIVAKYIQVGRVARESPPNGSDEDAAESNEEPEDEQATFRDWSATSVASYAVGCILGRWDVRYPTGERQPPELRYPFAPLPVCSPGMLQGLDGLPLRETPDGYPLRIEWDGILIDDAEHPDDVIRRVREVLELVWKDGAEAIEQEVCEILGVTKLRDYVRKPGTGGFWGRPCKMLLQEPPQGPHLLASPVVAQELRPLTVLPPARQRSALQGPPELR
jgi:hypothetical protein